jgi:hypothetical protein
MGKRAFRLSTSLGDGLMEAFSCSFDYSCIKEIALREPLVDTVDLKTVVTKACPILVSPSTQVMHYPS